MWRFHAGGLAPEAWTAAPSSQHSAVTHRQQRACSEVFAGEKRAGPAGAPLLLLELTVFPAERGGAHPSVLARDGRHGERLDRRPPGVRGIPSTDLSICFRPMLVRSCLKSCILGFSIT